MASTIKTSRLTKNECWWQEKVGSQLIRSDILRVPKTIEKGFSQGKLFYYIGDFFGENVLASQFPPDEKRLAEWLSKIAGMAYRLGQLECRKDLKKKYLPAGEKLLEAAAEWVSQVNVDLEPLLKIIESVKNNISRCCGHGDFTPWHMYELEDGKIGLVDAEHAGWGPKYYDVAYFYTRVRNGLKNKQLANQFLINFKGLLPKKDQVVFWDEIKPVLAQRLIGDYWRARNNREELTRFEEYKKEIIGNKILVL